MSSNSQVEGLKMKSHSEFVASRGVEGPAHEIMTRRYDYLHLRSTNQRRSRAAVYQYHGAPRYDRDRLLVSFVESVIRRRLRIAFSLFSLQVSDHPSPEEVVLAAEFMGMADHLLENRTILLSGVKDSQERSPFSRAFFANPRIYEDWRYELSSTDAIRYPPALLRYVQLDRARQVYRPEWLDLLKRTITPGVNMVLFSLSPSEESYGKVRSVNVLPLLSLPWQLSLAVAGLEALLQMELSEWFEPAGTIKDWCNFLNRTVAAIQVRNLESQGRSGESIFDAANHQFFEAHLLAGGTQSMNDSAEVTFNLEQMRPTAADIARWSKNAENDRRD